MNLLDWGQVGCGREVEVVAVDEDLEGTWS